MPDAPTTLTGRKLKVTVVLDAEEIARLTVPVGIARIPVMLDVGGRRLQFDVNAKSLRRVVTTLTEANGTGTVIVQGVLVGERIEEAGITCQLPKPAAAAA